MNGCNSPNGCNSAPAEVAPPGYRTPTQLATETWVLYGFKNDKSITPRVVVGRKAVIDKAIHLIGPLRHTAALNRFVEGYDLPVGGDDDGMEFLPAGPEHATTAFIDVRRVLGSSDEGY